jgi:hypothetical protein
MTLHQMISASRKAPNIGKRIDSVWWLMIASAGGRGGEKADCRKAMSFGDRRYLVTLLTLSSRLHSIVTIIPSNTLHNAVVIYRDLVWLR